MSVHVADCMALRQAWNNLQGSLKASSCKKVPEMTTVTLSHWELLGQPGDAFIRVHTFQRLHSQIPTERAGTGQPGCKKVLVCMKQPQISRSEPPRIEA